MLIQQHTIRAWFFAVNMAMVTALVPLPAGAHGSAPAGLNPFLVDGELVGAVTNLGLVLDVDGVPTWRTSLDLESTLNWFGYVSAGRILVGTSDNILVTEDMGCTFEEHSEVFGGQDVKAMALHPETGRPHLLATATEDTSNAIHITSDGGETWALVEGTETQDRYLALRYARSADHYIAMRTGRTPGMYVFSQVSVLGEVIQSVEVFLGEADDLRLITPAASAGVILIAAFIADTDPGPVGPGEPLPGTDTLYSVNMETGASTSVATFTGTNRFYSGGVFQGETYLTDFLDQLFRLEDGNLVPAGQDTRYCVDDSLSADTLWACGIRPQEHAFYKSSDGDTWEGLMLFDDIVVSDCPNQAPDSDVSEPDFSGAPSDDDASPAEDDSAKSVESGGCASAPVGLGWILWGLVLVRRRYLSARP